MMTRFRQIAEISEKTVTTEDPVEDAGIVRPEGGAELYRPSFLPTDILEQFIKIRDQILDERREPPARVVGVTSSRQKEGKTTVATCLAIATAIARPGRVLLVDGNLRSPAVHSFFHLPKGPGLAETVQEDRPAQEVIQTLEEVPLKVLTSGETVLTPTEILSHDRFMKRILEFRDAFDVVIIDTPSASESMDFELVGKRVDGMILILEADKTQLSLVQETRNRMESAQIQILGVTINRVRNPIPRFINKRFGLN